MGAMKTPALDFGHSLAKVLAPLCEWGADHGTEVSAVLQQRDRRAKEAERVPT